MIATSPTRARVMTTPSTWFKSACDMSPCPMAHIGIDHRFKYVNHAFVKMVGYSAEELYKKTWMDITHEEDIGGSLVSREALRNNGDYSYTRWKRYIHKNGREVPVIATVWRYPLHGGPAEGFTLTATSDIRERSLEELKETHEKLIRELEKRIEKMERFRETARIVAEFVIKWVLPVFAALGGFLAWLLARDK